VDAVNEIEVFDAELIDGDTLPAVRPATTPAPRYLVDKHTVLAPGQMPPTTDDRPQYSEADFRVSQRTVDRNAAAVPHNTQTNRDSAERAFRTWCTEHGRIPVPCTTATYTEYGTHLMDQGHKASTIRAYMSHVMAIQPKGDRPDPSLYRQNIGGYRRENPRANRTVRAFPLQLAHIAAMIGTCDTATPAGIRDAALLPFQYRYLARRIEVADVMIEDLTITDTAITVYIPQDKTHQDEEQEQVLHDHPDLQLIARLRAWLGWLAAQGVTTGPVFRALTKTGKLASRHHATQRGDALSGRAINEIVKKRFAATGLSSDGKPVRSHGVRAGASTDLGENGIRGRDLAAAGRWAEDSRIPETVYVRPARTRSFDPFEGVRLP